MYDSKDDRHTLRGGSAKGEHKDMRLDGVTMTARARRRRDARSTQEAILDAVLSAPIPAPVTPLRRGKTEWDRFDRMYEASFDERVRAANITYASPERKREMAVKALIKAHGGPKTVGTPAWQQREKDVQRVKIEHAISLDMPVSRHVTRRHVIDATKRSAFRPVRTSAAGVRVAELAKECGLTVQAVVGHVTRMGEYVKDGRSTVAEPIARMVREDLGAYTREVELVACGCKVYENGLGERKVIHSKTYGCVEAYVTDPLTDPAELERHYRLRNRV